MNGKLFLAALLGAITHFVLGFLFYGQLLQGFFEANVITYEGLMVEGNQAMIGYGLSSLAFAVLLTYILQKSGGLSGRRALSTSGIVSLLLAVSINVVFYFGMNIGTGLYFIVDGITFTVMGTLTGMVIGLVMGRSKQPAATGASVA